MKIRTFYSAPTEVVGQEFTIPSVTEPDRAMSIQQLVSEYSIGRIPNASVLQDYIDAQLEFDKKDVDPESYELTAEHDFKFADKVDVLERFVESSNVRKAVVNKLKEQRRFKLEQQQKLLNEYKDKFGDLETK